MPPPPAADGGAGASVDGITPLIDQAIAIFGTYEVTITPAATREDGVLNSQIIEWQAARDRDLMKVTPQLQQAAEAGMSVALVALFNENLPLAGAVHHLGLGVLDHINGRMQNMTDHGAPDVSMNPLRPSTIASKGHAVIFHGVTSDLARGLAEASVTTTKVG